MDTVTATNIVRDELRAYLTDPYVLAGGRSRGGLWIFTDDPRQDATFPRVQISKFNNTNQVLTIGPEYFDHERLFLNLTVYVKNDFKVVINGVTYKNEQLVDYIQGEIKKVLKSRFSSLQSQGVGGFRNLSTSNIVYEPDSQLYYGTVSIRVWFFWR